jgi:hypothetical protein
MARRRVLAVLVGAGLGVAASASPAGALAPGHANITFKVGSTVNQAAGDVQIAQAIVVWTPGASDHKGVGCCTYDVEDDDSGDQQVDETHGTSYAFTWNSDYSEAYRIDGYDANGTYVGTAFTNALTFVSQFGVVPENQGTFTGRWTTVSNPAALGGTLDYSTARGASASLSDSVRTLGWVTTVGPTHGSAKVYIDGKLVKTVSTYARTTGYRRIMFVRAWFGGPNDPSHTIRIVNAGTPGHSRVDVDGFINVAED